MSTMTAEPLSPRPSPVLGWLALAVSLAVTLAMGALGSIATASSVGTWYAGLEKPAFNPPNWVFGPVWTALYVLMAVAAWRVWRGYRASAAGRRALAAYGVQLVLNLAWSWLFFGLRSPGWALAEIAVMWAAIAATLVMFRRLDRVAGLLLVPYLAWVSFASVLNFAIWRLN